MHTVGEVTALESHATWAAAFQALHGAFTVTRTDVAAPARQLAWQTTGRFNLNWCGGASQSFSRAAHHVRADPRGTFGLLVPLHGTAVARTGDGVTGLAVGTAALCDFDRPVQVSHGEDFAALALVLPQSEIEARDPRLAATGSVIDTTRGAGALVTRLVTALHGERSNIDEPEFDAACGGLVDLVCLAAAGADDAPPQHGESIADGVRRYVAAHAHERDLDVVRIAAALGWSTRHIQAVLQECGTTARDLVREQRLRLAHSRLTGRGWSDASVTDIAHACGFATPSSFASAFRAEYGTTPSAVRAAALAAAPAAPAAPAGPSSS